MEELLRVAGWENGLDLDGPQSILDIYRESDLLFQLALGVPCRYFIISSFHQSHRKTILFTI